MGAQAWSKARGTVESLLEPLEHISQHFTTKEELLTSYQTH